MKSPTNTKAKLLWQRPNDTNPCATASMVFFFFCCFNHLNLNLNLSLISFWDQMGGWSYSWCPLGYQSRVSWQALHWLCGSWLSSVRLISQHQHLNLVTSLHNIIIFFALVNPLSTVMLMPVVLPMMFMNLYVWQNFLFYFFNFVVTFSFHLYYMPWTLYAG